MSATRHFAGWVSEDGSFGSGEVILFDSYTPEIEDMLENLTDDERIGAISEYFGLEDSGIGKKPNSWNSHYAIDESAKYHEPTTCWYCKRANGEVI